MNEFSRMVILVTCSYLLLMATRLPQVASVPMGKHSKLGAVIVPSLVVFSFLALGVFLAFILF
jgi:hypothetical protein